MHNRPHHGKTAKLPPPMKLLLRVIYAVTASLVVVAAALALAGVGAWYYVGPSLPPVEALKEVQLQVPLRVYTRDGRLIAEYGEMRRIPLAMDQIPPLVVDAFLAAEDDRFFEHPGVDYQGIVRAGLSLALTGERRQGGGTITMQVARNFFLSREKTISRKVREIFLALRIERELDKREILELYLNKIFLGQRAYGIGAAAEVYFGKSIGELGLAEIATIAGLPKAPSRDNPVTDPDRAMQRRAYVLRRMLETGSIRTEDYDKAMGAPMASQLHGPTVETDAPYMGELVRQEMLDRYGPEAYTAGYVVTTTLDSRLQAAAVASLRSGLLEYDRRHGYRGPLAQVPWPPADGTGPGELLEGYTAGPGMRLGLVVRVEGQEAWAWVPELGEVPLAWSGMQWARRYINENNRGPAPEEAADVVSPGDVIELSRGDEGWLLTQTPDVQGAVVALDPMDGAVAALTGGFDFTASKFNRATQARRQPGSSFKPFVYSAALENGFTAATVVNDAPVVFDDDKLEEAWRPENYSRRFYGPTRLREALVRSRNLVSVRVMRAIGIGPAIEHFTHFGLARDRLPRDLSLALGSVTLTPLEVADAYATFANGGYQVDAYYIQRVAGPSGDVLFAADPVIACAVCEDQRAQSDLAPAGGPGAAGGKSGAGATGVSYIEPRYAAPAINRQNAYLIADMMRDVIRRGTGRRAMALGRSDLSGKTGTTNDRRDAWFSGFNGDLVATVWVGFDQERPLGNIEEGARTALPVWVSFMGAALDDQPAHVPPKPPGLVTVRISPDTGQLARAGEPGAIFETFRVGHVPEPQEARVVSPYSEEEDPEEPLF